MILENESFIMDKHSIGIFPIKDIMDDQKDNVKKPFKNSVSDQSLLTVPNYYEVSGQDYFLALAHRSQKIVTALYMLTDFVDVHDPLRALVRDTTSTVMHNLFSLMHAPKTERVEILSRSYNLLYATLSYLNILCENGFISKMNHSIVSHEIVLLCLDIDTQIKKNLPYHRKENNNRIVKEFVLTESFFKDKNDQVYSGESIKDINKEKDLFIKDNNNMSLIKKDSPLDTVRKEVSQKIVPTKNNDEKNNRQENILKILKQKKDASINDICLLIKDCSSKTIQRDLVTLIEKGLVKKEGDRRWSTYNLSY